MNRWKNLLEQNDFSEWEKYGSQQAANAAFLYTLIHDLREEAFKAKQFARLLYDDKTAERETIDRDLSFIVNTAEESLNATDALLWFVRNRIESDASPK